MIQDHLIQRPARLDTPRRSPRERLALARLAPRCRRCADLRRHPRTQHPHTRSAPAVHLLWLVFNLLFPKMSTYTPTKSARINSHVTAAEESALAGFFGQKNSHSLRRALSSKITMILCNLGHKRTVTDSQSKPRAAPVGSACGLKPCAGQCRCVSGSINTPPHTLNKVPVLQLDSPDFISSIEH